MDIINGKIIDAVFKTGQKYGLQIEYKFAWPKISILPYLWYKRGSVLKNGVSPRRTLQKKNKKIPKVYSALLTKS